MCSQHQVINKIINNILINTQTWIPEIILPIHDDPVSIKTLTGAEF